MEKKRGRPRNPVQPHREDLELQHQHTPLPVLFVNRELEVLSANDYALKNCQLMTRRDGLRSSLPAGSADECVHRLAEEGDFSIELPLLASSRGTLVFSAIREKEQVVGAMVMILPREEPKPTSLAETVSSSAGGPLTGLINDVVSQISSALVPMRTAARMAGDERTQGRLLAISREVYRLFRASQLLNAYLEPCPSKDFVDPPVSWGVVDFWSKLSYLLDASNSILRLKNIPFNYDLPKKEARVYCCFDRIALALLAVIDNSFRYTRPDNQVLVIGENTPEGVRVKVTDRGRGISPEDLGKIFHPFYSRGAGGEPLVEQNLGLGLTVARQIIYGHDGTMVIESTLGEGTTVVFTLPITNEEITPPIIMKSDLAYYLEDHFSLPRVILYEHVSLP